MYVLCISSFFIAGRPDSANPFQKNVEDMRKNLGTDWLYALQAQKQQSSKDIAAAMHPVDQDLLSAASAKYQSTGPYSDEVESANQDGDGDAGNRANNPSPVSFKSLEHEESSSYKSFTASIPAPSKESSDTYSRREKENNQDRKVETKTVYAPERMEFGSVGRSADFIVGSTDSEKFQRQSEDQFTSPSIYPTRQRSISEEEKDYGE